MFRRLRTQGALPAALAACGEHAAVDVAYDPAHDYFTFANTDQFITRHLELDLDLDFLAAGSAGARRAPHRAAGYRCGTGGRYSSMLWYCLDLYGKSPPAHLLMIQGCCWDLEIGMSPSAERGLQRAVVFFKDQPGL